MSITNGYCMLTEFKQWLTSPGQTLSTDIPDDGVIESVIESASRFIDAECSRRFYKNSTDETRYYTASEPGYIRPDDLVSVTALYTDDGARNYTDAWSTDDFDLWPYNAALEGRPYVQIVLTPYSRYYFPVGVGKGVKVTGVFGWPSIPTQITEACMQIVTSVYKARFGENASSVSTITAAGIVITPQDIPAGAWAKINPFRKRI